MYPRVIVRDGGQPTGNEPSDEGFQSNLHSRELRLDHDPSLQQMRNNMDSYEFQIKTNFLKCRIKTIHHNCLTVS